MRSEHRLKGDECDAFTGWRKVMIWRAGQRKRAKKRSHRRDRRAARQASSKEVNDGRQSAAADNIAGRGQDEVRN